MPSEDNKEFDTSTFGKKMFEKKSREMLAPDLDIYQPEPPSMEDTFGKDFLQQRTMELIEEMQRQEKPSSSLLKQIAGPLAGVFGGSSGFGEGEDENKMKVIPGKESAPGFLQKIVADPEVIQSELERLKKMKQLNGTEFDNGERSQGDQEAEQRADQNNKTSLSNRTKKFLNIFGQ